MLRKKVAFTLAPVDKTERSHGIEALPTPVICCPADAVNVYPRMWCHLQDIRFHEDFPRSEQEIDVVIGLDFYYSFVTREIVKGGPNEPVAVRTISGWVFCGPTGDCGQECSVCMNVQVSTDEHLNDTLQKFWNLESIGIKPVETEASASHTEPMILQNFKNTLVHKDGRYEVSLPWKEGKGDYLSVS